MAKVYKYRYLIEPGEWAGPKKKHPTVIPGVTVSPDHYGYADDVIMISLVRGESGNSYLILSSIEQGPPSKETLLSLQEMIAHQLEKHT